MDCPVISPANIANQSRACAKEWRDFYQKVDFSFGCSCLEVQVALNSMEMTGATQPMQSRVELVF